MEIAPGSILHSSHVNPALVNACLGQMGMNEEQSAQTAQTFFNLMNMLALKIAPPPPPNQEAAASRPSPPDLETAMVEDDKAEDQQEPNDQAEGEFTDGSTDTEAEAKAASENLPPTKIKKKKKRGGGKGNQGKGTASESTKTSVTGKLQKKN